MHELSIEAFPLMSCMNEVAAGYRERSAYVSAFSYATTNHVQLFGKLG